MRKRLHIATLGLYRNVLAEHVMAKRGADVIALIHTEKNEKDMRRIKEEKETRGIDVIPVKVNPWDFDSILAAILSIASKYEDRDFDIEYNISCGTRVMTAAAYRASLFTDSKVFFMTDPYGEKIGKIVEVQPLSVAMLSEQKRGVLNKIHELGGTVSSQKELGSRTNLGVSSISKHLNSLRDAGYVIKERKGKRTEIKITDLGKIVLDLKKYRKGKFWGTDE